MTAIILQARLDSTRLPRKALLLLDGKPVIVRVMEALNSVPADIRVLACPEDSKTAFAPLTETCGFKLHTGPKEDVLERYCQVIRRFDITRVIRATGDNPFVFADTAAAINDEAVSLGADYACYTDLPYGAGVEVVSASALLNSAALGATAYDREHVCPFLYTHPEQYKLHRPAAPVCWNAPDLRLTIDTQEDYERAVVLYSALNNVSNRYSGEEIIKAAKGLGTRD